MLSLNGNKLLCSFKGYIRPKGVKSIVKFLHGFVDFYLMIWRGSVVPRGIYVQTGVIPWMI